MDGVALEAEGDDRETAGTAGIVEHHALLLDVRDAVLEQREDFGSVVGAQAVARAQVLIDPHPHAVIVVWMRRFGKTPGVRIAIAADHAGFTLKAELVPWLEAAGHEVADLGTDSEASVDYPPFCAAAARAVVRGDADLGIVLGGSGQGEQIAANKVHGARAALCHDLWMARMARSHNDANVLSMGARVVTPAMAKEIVTVFLDTAFEGDRHVRRVELLRVIEDEECAAG